MKAQGTHSITHILSDVLWRACAPLAASVRGELQSPCWEWMQTYSVASEQLLLVSSTCFSFSSPTTPHLANHPSAGPPLLSHPFHPSHHHHHHHQHHHHQCHHHHIDHPNVRPPRPRPPRRPQTHHLHLPTPPPPLALPPRDLCPPQMPDCHLRACALMTLGAPSSWPRRHSAMSCARARVMCFVSIGHVWGSPRACAQRASLFLWLE